MKKKPKKTKTNLNTEKDQHLLKDKKIIEKEISLAEIKDKDKIIEIGGGKGYLTEKLAKTNVSKILCFEIDENFKSYLDGLEKKYKNLEIKYGNALKTSWEDYNKIISNIPYSISEPLINKSIKSKQEKLVLIVGEKFKEKLDTKNKKSTIGIISNLFYDIKAIKKIPKEKFTPPPRIDSWLIVLNKKTLSKADKIEKILMEIIQYRGKIKNAIIWALIWEAGKTKNQARDLMKKMKIKKQVLEKPTTRITGKFILKLKEELPSYL